MPSLPWQDVAKVTLPELTEHNANEKNGNFRNAEQYIAAVGPFNF